MNHCDEISPQHYKNIFTVLIPPLNETFFLNFVSQAGDFVRTNFQFPCQRRKLNGLRFKHIHFLWVV